MANGEPVSLLDAVETHVSAEGVHVHQVHAIHDRPYLHGGPSVGPGSARRPTRSSLIGAASRSGAADRFANEPPR